MARMCLPFPSQRQCFAARIAVTVAPSGDLLLWVAGCSYDGVWSKRLGNLQGYSRTAPCRSKAFAIVRAMDRIVPIRSLLCGHAARQGSTIIHSSIFAESWAWARVPSARVLTHAESVDAALGAVLQDVYIPARAFLLGGVPWIAPV